MTAFKQAKNFSDDSDGSVNASSASTNNRSCRPGTDNTGQRLQSCIQDIQQLETLRLKHKLLMEQLRRDYPSMRSFVKSLEVEDLEQVSCTTTSSNSPGTSNPTSGSSDSGFGQQKTSSSSRDPLMDYSTFRKLSLEERREPTPPPSMNGRGHIVENTLKNVTARNASAIGQAAWARLRPKVGPLDDVSRPRSCYGALENEPSAARPASLIVTSNKRGSRILDTGTFSQLTPPPVQRKFATVEPPIRLEGPLKVQTKAPPVHRVECVSRPKEVSPLAANSRALQWVGAQKDAKPPPRPLQPIRPNNAYKRNSTAGPMAQAAPAPAPVWRKRSSMAEDSTVLCSADVLKFAATLPNPKSEQNAPTPAFKTAERLRKNVASVSPIMKLKNEFEALAQSSQRTIPKPCMGSAAFHRPVCPVTIPAKFTSSCTIAISVPSRNPDKPVIRLRRPKEWHESENL